MGKPKEKHDLPPFGHYSMKPNWYLNYCLPKLSPPANVMFDVIWGRSRPLVSGEFEAGIRRLMRLSGMSSGLVQRSISELAGHDLIQIISGPSGKSRKTYKVVVYSPEAARLKFKDMPKTVCRKTTQKRVPKCCTDKAEICADSLHTIQ